MMNATLDIHKQVAYYHRHGAYITEKGFAVTKKPVRVTDAELAVLKVLWARGPLTAKAITLAVYPDGANRSLPPSIRFCNGWSVRDW